MKRLNLGSGKHNWPNAINVDLDPRADVVTPVDTLTAFMDGEVDEIYAIHLFEHLHRLQLNKPLNEWHRVLRPGGRLILELPSLDKIARMIVDGVDDVGLTLFGLFGDVRESSPYMRHQWCYTTKEITKVLQEAGFAVEVTEPVYHVKARDLRVIATKH